MRPVKQHAASGLTYRDEELWNLWLEFFVGLDMRAPDNFDLTLTTQDDPARYSQAIELRRQWEAWRSAPRF
ncbi:MAG: hypothetical protein F9B45_28595 [Phycisphaera sp. RhM]|nr:hypothetical protein [Phycisphaera sp. RhM]